MKKATRNYIVDAVQGLLFLAQAISGFILWHILPSGQGGMGRGGYDSVFIFARHTWLDIHKWVGAALLAAIIVHLILHWRWVVYMARSYFR